MLDLTSPHIRAALAQRIKTEYDQASIKLYDEDARNYLGASSIGKECERDLYYDFRWFRKPSFIGRIMRLFQRGHREEPIAIAHYRLLDFVVNDIDPDTGKQWRFKAIHGHFGGGCDGRGFLPKRYEYYNEIGYEIKTANLNQFNQVKKQGVRKWKPHYASQMDVYGKAWGLKYFVFIVVCKNDDETHFEIYECDYANADAMLARGFRIVGARRPPPKIANSPTFSVCKICDSVGVCHGQRMPPKNCRTCTQSEPGFNSTWLCNANDDHIIPDEVIRKGCENWEPIQ